MGDLVLTSRPGAYTRGVRVRFANPAATLISYRLAEFPEKTTLEVVDVFSSGAEVTWSPAVPDARVVLSLELSGGASPAVEREMWRDKDRMLWGEVYSADDAVLLQAASIFELATRSALLDCVRDALLEAIPQSPDPAVRRARQFYCDLDFSTNPKLVALAGGGREFNRRRLDLCHDLAGKILVERVLRRLDAAVAEPGSVPDEWADRADDELIPIIREVSQFQLEIYRRHFGSKEGGFDLDAVWHACMAFANGELRMPGQLWENWNGEPDGAYLFLFAEFGFLAHWKGVEPDAWEALLAPLVAMQRVYMRAYRPAGDPLGYRFGDYKPDNFSTRYRLRGGKAQIREEYENLPVDQLKVRAGQNARDAFPASARVTAPVVGG